MITPHEILLVIGLAAAASGWFAHMAWNGFQNWLDDRAEARTPEGRARLLAEREHDAAWKASQEAAVDALSKLAARHTVPVTPGPLRQAESRTAAMGALSPAVLAAEHEAELRNAEARRLAATQAAAADGTQFVPHARLRDLPEPAYAGSDDRFTDGTGPLDAVAAEISGVGAMVAVPKDRRENLGPDTAEISAVHGPHEDPARFAEAAEYHDGQLRAADAERGKWGFVPVRMGTPPHGYPLIGGNGGPSYFHGLSGPYASGGAAAHRPAALEALDADQRRAARLLAKADAVVSPKADWDEMARQIHHEHRELVNA